MEMLYRYGYFYFSVNRKCVLPYLMYFPLFCPPCPCPIKITFGQMESSLQLLRLNDTRQCRPFWHVVSLLLFHSIWKLRLPAFSGPWALVTHDDALQCLFPRWEADTLMSVCPDGVADTLIKVGWRERLRESVRRAGEEMQEGREREGRRDGGMDFMKAFLGLLPLVVFLGPDYTLLSLLSTSKGSEGTGLLSLPRSGPLSLGQHPTHLPSSPVWQRASFQPHLKWTRTQQRHALIVRYTQEIL